MTTFLYGMTAMGCAVAALVFLRHWRQSLDRLFFTFSLAFWLLAFNYVVRGLYPAATEWQLSVFLVRLLAFCLILYAIVQKNRR